MKKTSGKPVPGEGNAALLVIDVQQAIFEKSTPVYKADELLGNINRLIERARGTGVAVVYIQHNDRLGLVKGSPGWQLHARLAPPLGDASIDKQHPNAFEDTRLAEVLQGLGARRLVACGLVTHGCVRATCIGALELGYTLTLAADAHSSYSPQAAELIEKWNEKLASLGAQVKPSAQINFPG